MTDKQILKQANKSYKAIADSMNELSGWPNGVLPKNDPALKKTARKYGKKLLREDKSGKTDFTYVGIMYGAFSRVIARFQMGEVKYARLNWRNCEDPQTYKESAVRHLMQYINGEVDEDHLGAACANILILLDLEEQAVEN